MKPSLSSMPADPGKICEASSARPIGVASARRRRARATLALLLACGAFAIAVVLAGTAYFVSSLRERELTESHREFANLALMLAGEVDRAFKALEVLQRSVVEDIHELEIRSDEEYNRKLSGYDIHQVLKHKISGFPHIQTLTIINATGKIINSTRNWPMADVSAAGRDYFQALSKDGAPPSFLSPPRRSRASGLWTIYMAHRVMTPDNRFLGLVAGGIEVRYFEQLFGAIQLGEKSSITLIQQDGRLLARAPPIEGAVGQSFGRLGDLLKDRDHVNVRLPGQTNGGAERLFAGRKLAHYPLIAAVGKDVSAVLADWQRRAGVLVAAGGLFSLAIGIITLLVARRLLQGQRESETVQRQAEREAEEAHARLREAIEVVPESLVLFDSADRYVLWNQRYGESHAERGTAPAAGMRFEEMLRAQLDQGRYPDAVGREEEWLQRRLAMHRQPESVHEEQLDDGRWLRVHERRTADGGSIGIRVDITELKRRESSFRLLFESNPVPMWVIDHDAFRFLAVNDAAIRHYGYTREQFLGMSMLDIRPPEDREAIRKVAGSGFGGTSRHLKADGTLIYVAVFAQLLEYEGRTASIAAIMDLTDRKRAEDEVERTKAFLDTVIQNVPSAIAVKDARDLRYVMGNRAAEKQWGRPRAEVIGKTVHDVFPEPTASAVAAMDRKALQGGGQDVAEEQNVQTAIGRRIVRATRVVIPAEGEPQFLLTVHDDITERKQIEEQLHQSQKMEAVGRLTGGLAHDFNNLLMIIIGNIDLLQGELAAETSAAQTTETILEAALRGAELTRQLLAFSRRQPLQPKLVDANDLIQRTVRLLTRTLGENIAIELHPGSDVGRIRVDEAQFESALLNIAINARDAMANGGKLIVETETAEFDAEDASIHPDINPGRHVVIMMTDTGSGMPPDVLARIFEPFFTTKETGRGTGLGLSMVYGFIKQSGGHINAYSEVGRGTTFRLYLPAEQPTGAAGDGRLAAPDRPQGGRGEVVLAVDDNPNVRATVCKHLVNLGYQVLTAEDGDTALRELESAPSVDLLFTDIVMPGGMDGKELAIKARALRPGLKVLFTSGFPGNSLGDAGLQSGNALLGKPYRKHELAKKLREVLDAEHGQPAEPLRRELAAAGCE
jgi:PAS domain S-box-containing protein